MTSSTPSVPAFDPADVDMGIWADDGRIWLPKQLYTTRNDAKQFAVEEAGATWIDVRVRSRWMKYAPTSAFDDTPYFVTEDRDPEGFECWEIR